MSENIFTPKTIRQNGGNIWRPNVLIVALVKLGHFRFSSMFQFLSNSIKLIQFILDQTFQNLTLLKILLKNISIPLKSSHEFFGFISCRTSVEIIDIDVFFQTFDESGVYPTIDYFMIYIAFDQVKLMKLTCNKLD